jgi:DNA-binding NarL/FixJ family response regulator
VLGELTSAERGVFTALIEGNTIAASSVSTIANQKTSIFKKLGVKNTDELVGIFRNW